MEGVLAIVFGLGIPGLIIISWIFFRSKERQMIIERDLTKETIESLYKTRRDPFLMLKIGIVVVFLGLGIGLGLYMEEVSQYDFWPGFLIVTFTGIGFIISFLVTRKMQKEEAAQ